MRFVVELFLTQHQYPGYSECGFGFLVITIGSKQPALQYVIEL